MEDDGPTNGQRPPFQSGTVKPKQRQGFAEATLRRNPDQHDHGSDSWRQHGHDQACLADPWHTKITATASTSVIA
jgi:hypothetical protein